MTSKTLTDLQLPIINSLTRKDSLGLQKEKEVAI